jgi:hypothetical protein
MTEKEGAAHWTDSFRIENLPSTSFREIAKLQPQGNSTA